jgi:hypothetical protein
MIALTQSWYCRRVLASNNSQKHLDMDRTKSILIISLMTYLQKTPKILHIALLTIQVL